MQRSTIGKEVPSDDGRVIHDHRGSMQPKDLGTARDLIEVERTDRGRHPDTRHPMHMTVGDHHVGPTGSPAVEIPCRRDVCAPAGRENLLVPGQAFADCCSTIPHEVAEVGHLAQRRPSRVRLESERAGTFLNDTWSNSLWEQAKRGAPRRSGMQRDPSRAKMGPDGVRAVRLRVDRDRRCDLRARRRDRRWADPEAEEGALEGAPRKIRAHAADRRRGDPMVMQTSRDRQRRLRIAPCHRRRDRRGRTPRGGPDRDARPSRRSSNSVGRRADTNAILHVTC